MENEKYLNYYIETLTSTLTDVIIRNVSMQANARVSEDVINDQAKRIEELSVLEANQSAKLMAEIETLRTANANLNNELNDFRNQRSEYEAVKNQANHVDTFRNELIKERELHQKTRNDYEAVIKSLNEQIDYLQLTPAKRKKLDEAKQTKTVDVFSSDSSAEPTDTIRDGGSF